MAQTAAAQPMLTDVKTTDLHATGTDGAEVLLRRYVKEGGATGPAVLCLHDGGMISGSAAPYDGPISRYVSTSGVAMLAVDYRLAPEYPYPTPLEDCYSGLQWLAEHAGELGVDVTVELHLRPGVPHKFETYAYATAIARRFVADRLRVPGTI